MYRILVLLLFILSYSQLYSQWDYGGIIDHRITFPTIKYFQKNDTIFECELDTNNCLVSINIYKECAIKWQSRSKWMTSRDSTYCIIKFKKVKSSKWFKENSSKLPDVDFECKPKYRIGYNSDGSIIKRVYFWNMVRITEKKPSKNAVKSKKVG